MATTKEIMVNGVVTSVTEFDHPAQQIDDATARALEGGAIDQLLAGKENSFSVLPLNKGGTGVQNLTALRRQVGIGFSVDCDAGSSVNITLPSAGTYLICASDNVRTGAILVETTNLTGSVYRVTNLSAPRNWSYAIGDKVLTLSETHGAYKVTFFISSFSAYTYG